MGESESLYRSFLREISHSLRSPLSVIVGVVDDQLKGYSCSQEDFEAARDSLAKIRAVLDLIKYLGVSSNSPQQVNLKDFLTAQESIGISQKQLCSVQDVPSSLEVNIDPLVIASLLKIIFLLLQQKEERDLFLDASVTPDLESGERKVTIQVYGNHKSDNQLSRSGSDLKKYASFTLEQFGLQEIVWELLKANCSRYQIECSQVWDSEKNARFILTF